MSRFFVDSLFADPISVSGDDARHISLVLRLKQGDFITLCDGKGSECEGRIISVSPSRIEISPGIVKTSDSEPLHKITLFQCLPKTGKMETVIQKGTELGMDALCPVQSSRCVALPGKDYDKKLDRYRKVAVEAAMQSRRGSIPCIHSLCLLQKLDFSDYDTVLLAYEEEKSFSLKKALSTAGIRIALIIGPEGGFSADEADLLQKKGAVSVSLGPRILRTETAGPAAIAQILFGLEG